ncbi:MAG: ATP-dependent Clp protease proteolytic subunit [Rikenellaceae bacterium]|nr:ATP-dependent Clp protease proteolytic subunit [Rikenellaceae bacterium]
MNSDQIKINNQGNGTTIIDIEGVIGVPEESQFDNPNSRIATYQKFKDAVEQIAQIRTPQVVVNIRSTGGDVEDALLIYDALRALDTKVTTRCAGYVASAATIIAQAASEGEREITPEALYLIHRSAMSVEGDATTLRHNAELLEKTDQRIAEVYSRRSGHDIEEFVALMNENNGTGRWMSPEEAMNAGLVDRIIESPQTLGWSAKVRAWVKRVIGRGDRLPYPTPPQDVVRSTIRQSNTEGDKHIELFREEQQRVGPTTIKATEDPTIHDIKKSFNQEAYSRDIESFKH